MLVSGAVVVVTNHATHAVTATHIALVERVGDDGVVHTNHTTHIFKFGAVGFKRSEHSSTHHAIVLAAVNGAEVCSHYTTSHRLASEHCAGIIATSHGRAFSIVSHNASRACLHSLYRGIVAAILNATAIITCHTCHITACLDLAVGCDIQILDY